MKVTADPRNIDLTGSLDTKEFTIKVGHHIMSILSGLYTDPTDAIVREYLTNMNDAYIALFRENPGAQFIAPVIHAPSELAPYVEFRDYGIGMPDDVVWNVFTQYGNSTKNDNNDEVGGFGIGSKTAFCYNNGSSWSIESRYKGTVRRYIAFVNDKQIPTLTLVSSEPTDEPSGVTINIPVLRHDIGSVRKAIEKYAPHFPRALTVENITVSTPESIFEGTGWKIVRSSGISGAQVVMGNVPYTIDSTASGFSYGALTGAGVSQSIASMVTASNRYSSGGNVTLFISLPVGSVDIVPSRDGLKYSDKTKAVLYAALRAVDAESASIVAKSIANARTVRDAHKAFKFSETLFSRLTNVDYKNYKLFSEGWVVSAAVAATVDHFVVASYPPESAPLSTTDRNGGLFVHYPEGNTLVMINDLGKNDRAVAKAGRVARGLVNARFMGKTRSGRVSKYSTKAGNVYVISNTTLTAAQLADIFAVPSDCVMFASGVLPTVVLKADTKEASVYRWRHRNIWDARVKMPTGAGPYYYIPLVKEYGGRYGNNKLERVMRCLHRVDGAALVSIQNPIFGVKDTDVASLSSDWVDLFDYLSTQIASKIPSAVLTMENSEYTFHPKLESMLPQVVKSLGTAAPADLQAYAESITKKVTMASSAAYSTALSVLRLADSLDVSYKSPRKNDRTSEGEALIKKYPVLVLLHEIRATHYGNFSFSLAVAAAVKSLL